MKKILPILCFSIFCNLILAQKIVEISLQETLSKDELSARIIGFSVDYGVEAYKVLYETLDTDGSIDTASGLFVLPITENEDIRFPLLAYQHGTASQRDAVPSNLENGERLLIYFFAGKGYFATAADYLGLGDSKRIIHPYIHADSEASAGIDLVKAAKSYLEAQDIHFAKQLFITGYSQGGHAGMAMHKALNDEGIDGIEVTAGSHMSGIYNTEGELLKSSLSESVYNFPSYVVWIIVSYQSVYGNLYNDLSEVFREEYTTEIRGFVEGVITRSELNGLLVTELTNNHGASIPRYLLKEEFVEDFENNPDNPFRLALRDNNLFDWIPKAPMRMMYCMADDQVAFTNSTFTDSVMNANGAVDVMATDVNPLADHGGCVIPASLSTLLFFEQYTNRSSTNTVEIDPTLNFQIQPNPATNYVWLSFKEQQSKIKNIRVQLHNINGQAVLERNIQNLQNFKISLNDIPSGLYLMQVYSEKGYWTQKVMIQK